MPTMQLSVRPARADDAGAAALLYVSAAPYYDAFAGGEQRARRLLASTYPRPRHAASHEVCRVALADGAVVGVLAAFPSADAGRLAGRFLALALWRLGPLRWPAMFAHLHASGRYSPRPPANSLYVDALAVHADARRQGVARALLTEAGEIARQRGLRQVALDTGIENAAAQALYEAAGFERSGEMPVRGGRAAHRVGGAGFVSYELRV